MIALEKAVDNGLEWEKRQKSLHLEEQKWWDHLFRKTLATNEVTEILRRLMEEERK